MAIESNVKLAALLREMAEYIESADVVFESASSGGPSYGAGWSSARVDSEADVRSVARAAGTDVRVNPEYTNSYTEIAADVNARLEVTCLSISEEPDVTSAAAVEGGEE